MPQKLPCQVQEIIDHGERVYSLHLKPERSLPRFLPGQFLHLALDEYRLGDFWPDSRPFSIASPPNEREHLWITYVVKGAFTGRMENEIHPGRMLWVKLPYGEFIVEAGNDVCLIAGGTGITALTAFLSGLRPDVSERITLCYGARRPNLLIYRELVENAAARCPRLQLQLFSELGSDSSGLIRGQIDISVIWHALADPPANHFYLTGPPEMLDMLARALLERGSSPEQIHIDAWE